MIMKNCLLPYNYFEQFQVMVYFLLPEEVSPAEAIIRQRLNFCFRLLIALFFNYQIFDFLFSPIWIHGYIWYISLINLQKTSLVQLFCLSFFTNFIKNLNTSHVFAIVLPNEFLKKSIKSKAKIKFPKFHHICLFIVKKNFCLHKQI